MNSMVQAELKLKSKKVKQEAKALKFFPTCRNQHRTEGSMVQNFSDGRGKIVKALCSLKFCAWSE